MQKDRCILEVFWTYTLIYQFNFIESFLLSMKQWHWARLALMNLTLLYLEGPLEGPESLLI